MADISRRRPTYRTFAERLAVLVLLAAAGGSRAQSPTEPRADPASIEFFENRIRPALVEHCYECHSSSAKRLKGGLRLDSRAGWQTGGESGRPSVIPGNPSDSPLLRALRYEDTHLQMPPQRKLPDAVVSDFERWIREGAADPRTTSAPANPQPPPPDGSHHWAFQPPRLPPLPAVRDAAWPHTPVDDFILASLEARQIQPSPPADRRTLIRRAYYGLLGLPPTPAEVDAFVRDASPEAWDRLIDRLLASPHYGERWGRHWLDVARYADTKGYVYYYEESRFVQPHQYRDWVIRAFNDDLPYNRFLELQIAADLLLPTRERPDATPSETQSASHPSRTSASSRSTLPWPPRQHDPNVAALGFLSLGRRFLDLEPDIIDDRMDVLMRGTQALTVGCARCHDHKFDPIPTRDYYSLYGVFLNSEERLAELAVPDATEPPPEVDQAIQAKIETFDSKFRAATEEVTRRLRDRVKDYLLAVLDVARLPSDANVRPQPEDINPFNVRQWERFLRARTNATDTLLTAWHAFARVPATEFAARAPEIVRALRTHSPAIPSLIERHVLQPTPTSMSEVAERYGDLFLRAHREWLNVCSNAPATTASAPPRQLPDPELEAFRQVLYGEDSPLWPPPGRIVDLDVHLYFDDPNRVALTKLQMELEQYLVTNRLTRVHTTILGDRPHETEAQVFRRGDPLQRGDVVPRQFLKVLSGPAQQPFGPGSGRRELAQAIASPRNPLTARVLVNRIWAQHFGHGLVRTPSDFGLRSEPPTHPELLDWLACRFMADGWSIKNLHRLILRSATYQQSSPSAADEHSSSWKLDPENRWLGRFPRQRLDLEAFRDTLFAVADDLDLRLGGPGQSLQQPPFSRRRTVYGWIDRRQLPGLVRAFDFANPDAHSPGRHTTTMPQQALLLLNHPLLAERARSLAQRLSHHADSATQERIRELFRRTLQRDPSPTERANAERFLAEANTNVDQPPQQTTPAPKPLDPWECLAHVLLVSNEITFID